MPVVSQKTENNRLVTTFETTPVMSSYLLAWVYGDMLSKTAKTKNDVEVTVWATVAQSDAALDFSLDIAVRALEFFEQYYGVPYPLPKCDHVALPDFSSGAMENWGLITYRESVLLVEPGIAGVSSRHLAALVIAHELSHQWFGNLVTMKWWNNLWLNESFANLMEYLGPDALHPEWQIWNDFNSHEAVAALRRDAIDGVQSVQVDVNHPDEISTLFDPAIVYAFSTQPSYTQRVADSCACCSVILVMKTSKKAFAPTLLSMPTATLKNLIYGALCLMRAAKT